MVASLASAVVIGSLDQLVHGPVNSSWKFAGEDEENCTLPRIDNMWLSVNDGGRGPSGPTQPGPAGAGWTPPADSPSVFPMLVPPSHPPTTTANISTRLPDRIC